MSTINNNEQEDLWQKGAEQVMTAIYAILFFTGVNVFAAFLLYVLVKAYPNNLSWFIGIVIWIGILILAFVIIIALFKDGYNKFSARLNSSSTAINESD